MDTILKEYLAEQYLSDLRSGKQFKPEFYRALFTIDVKDELRAAVIPSDRTIIHGLINATDKDEIVMGHLLSRKLLYDPDMRLLLLDTWNNAENPDVKIAIIYDLAEYTDIGGDMLWDFFDYIKKHRDVYEQHVIDWYVGRENILPKVLDKLALPSLKHKFWIYVINLSVSSDKEQAKMHLSKYLNSDDPFVRSVAEYAHAQL